MVNDFSQPCAIWWLSVDGFYGTGGRADNIQNAIVHYTQSEYARDHVHTNFGIRAAMLSDYISEAFAVPVAGTTDNLNRIAVSPPLGNRRELWMRRRALRKMRRNFPGAEIVEIGGMSRGQLKAALAEATVYVDLGAHPGKGRMPREAALLDAVVLVSRRGSAMNQIDTPIDECFKFDTVDEMIQKLDQALSNVDEYRAAQDDYRAAIRSERRVFMEEVSRVVEFAFSLAEVGPHSSGNATGPQ